MNKYFYSKTRRIVQRLSQCALIAVTCALCALPSTAWSDTQDEFDILMEKIRANKMSLPSDATIAGYITNMQANGSYADITYTKTDRTNWEPLDHIDRLVAMSKAYVNPKSSYYGTDTLYNKIVDGLQYWYDVNPYCSNWWYNQIAEPQRLGVIFVMMKAGKKQIPTTLANNTISRWKSDGGNPASWTGANRTDIALHWLYRGCVTKDASVLKTALTYLYDPMRYTTGEGFQVDNSYFQHGNQLYIGGYGDALLASVLEVTNYTQGTSYQIDDDRAELLSKFVRETFTDVIRGKTSNFDCLGRGMSRIGALRKTSNWTSYVKSTRSLDEDHAAQYDAILKRINGQEDASYQITPKHTHYYRGDYTLHMRPKYNFSVRTVSTRTMRNEYGNGENLKTYFVSDGCTDIARTGDEYYNLMPLWDWARIPGVTAPKLSTIPKASSDWQTAGTSTFAGGVSDTLYGASAYEYYDTYSNINTGGKKGWFFFDDEVVCLGASIKSSQRTYTTIDQCWGMDTLRVGMTSGNVLGFNKLSADKAFKDTAQWVLHNGIGYCFPKGGRVIVNNKDVSGKWTVINTTEDNVTASGRVFTVGFDHLIPTAGKASYAYIVVPGKTEEELRQYMAACPIEVAKNSDTVQVVHHKGLGVYEMVFFGAGQYQDDSIQVAVDHPCALIFKNLQSKSLTFHVADPGQTKEKITVQVSTAALGGLKEGSADYSTASSQYAGQTRTITLTADDETVGIDQVLQPKENLQVVLSPSAPRAGQPFGLYVKGAQDGTVEIFSAEGTLITRQALNGGDVNLTLPSAGVYVSRLRCNGSVQSSKILVRP